MISLFPALNDNYGFLLHEPQSGLTAAIDTPDGREIEKQCQKHGWKLSHVFNTHHHFDHIGGNEYLKTKYNVTIIAPREESRHIPNIDIELDDGDEFMFGNKLIKFIATPGHTLGHGIYYVPDEEAVFVGDTLFIMGCGRLFEGSAKQMFDSIGKIAQLPKNTKIYPAHEYTISNALFAQTIEPKNQNIKKALKTAQALRDKNLPTIPGTIEQELKTNPFMRAKTWEEFGQIREKKDMF